VLQVVGQFSYKLVVGIKEGDCVACSSIILSGGFAGVRIFLGSASSLHSMFGSQTNWHTKAEYL
jgi:hypothetical protein